MTHSTTTQDTPQWARDAAIEFLPLHLIAPQGETLAAIISRHAPKLPDTGTDHMMVAFELRGQVDKANRAIATKDARIVELEADNARFREALQSFVGLWDEWASGSGCLREPLCRSIQMRYEEAMQALGK